MNKLTTSNYYLAYLDILGTRNIVAKDKDDRYLNELNKIYENAINTKLTINNWDNIHINAKIFSDNIFIVFRTLLKLIFAFLNRQVWLGV